MDSHLTVADARTAFARFSLSNAEFLRRLNRSSEHFLNSDVYNDLFTVVRVSTSTGYVTIPRAFGRAYGIVQDELPKPVFSRWVEFVECGVARRSPSNMVLSGLVDMGNHFCTQSEVWSGGVQQAGTLRFKVGASGDAGKTVRVNGTGADDLDILSATGVPGEEITLADPSADSVGSFKEVQGIQIASGLVGRLTLWKVIGGVETQIGSYEPGETRPRYTRYKIGLTTDTLYLYCKRRHVPYVNDTDWIYPSNLDAHEFGFQAQTYRDRGDFKAENEAWTQGKKVLKDEYFSLIPPPRVTLTSEDYGGMVVREW